MISTAALAQRDEGSLALRARSPGRPPLRSSGRGYTSRCNPTGGWRCSSDGNGKNITCCQAVLLNPNDVVNLPLERSGGGRGERARSASEPSSRCASAAVEIMGFLSERAIPSAPHRLTAPSWRSWVLSERAIPQQPTGSLCLRCPLSPARPTDTGSTQRPATLRRRPAHEIWSRFGLPTRRVGRRKA
jgi:hypothetical protein